MRLVSFILMVFFSAACFAQTVFSGKVLDASTKEPIPFVNVGIVGKNKGTVTDDQGRFSLELPNELDNDTLRMSIIGYATRSWQVGQLKTHLQDSIITLEPADHQLKQVEVHSKRMRKKVLGNKSTSEMFTGSFTTDELGNEVGVKIDVGKGPVYLQSFKFSIASNQCYDAVLRVNIYNIKEELPDSNLLPANVVVSIPKKRGVIEVDLQPYQLVMSEDFIISVEYIKPCPSRSMNFSAAFLGTIYSRTTSQGQWYSLKGFDLGFNVEVRY